MQAQTKTSRNLTQVPAGRTPLELYQWWHVSRWKDCRRCELACQRSRIVLCRGVVPAEALFLGEAPGVSEDAIGLPFVGPAGQLLDQIVRMAEARLGRPLRALITNLVACFPREAKETEDHRPPDEAVLACSARLEELVRIARPRLLVCVGTLARDWTDPKRRGSISLDVPHRIVIDHPAFILRSNHVMQGQMVKKAALAIRSAVEGLSCD